MLAAVLSAPRRFELTRVPVPQPGPGQVRVRVEGCGICGSNGPGWEGRPWFRYPFDPGAPGHEGWGTVEAVADGVRDLVPGDRVAYLSNSALAEHDLVAVDRAVRLSDSLRGQPFPGEPLGCAMNVFRRSDVRAGQTVAVVGVGFIGAVVVRLARRAGARVIALGRRPYALEVARAMGADLTLSFEDTGRAVGEVHAQTGGALCDRVIEATGEQRPLDLAAQLARERGRLVIAGYHQDGPRQVDMQLWNWRGLDVINAHERDPAMYLDGMRGALDAVTSGVLDPQPLYTHRFSLSEVGGAFEALRTRPDGFMKALVTP
jgi:threonine dehydrogenase-like Zn-dependent dehydrogenase